MNNILLFLVSVALSANVFAKGIPKTQVKYAVQLAGIPQNEGRYIRIEVVENNKIKWGIYLCAHDQEVVYSYGYSTQVNQKPFHADYLIKFSICQNETLADCNEFAEDNYFTFRNALGYLENNKVHTTVDASAIADAFQACETNPVPEMDDLIKKSLFINDRHFSRVG